MVDDDFELLENLSLRKDRAWASEHDAYLPQSWKFVILATEHLQSIIFHNSDYLLKNDVNLERIFDLDENIDC